MKSASRSILGFAILFLFVPTGSARSQSPVPPKDPIGGMQAPEIMKGLKPFLGNGRSVTLKLTRNTPITDPFQEVREDVEQDVAVVSIKSVEQQGDDLFITLAGIDQDASKGMQGQSELLRISTDDGSFRVQGIEPGPATFHAISFAQPPAQRKTATLVKDASLQQ